MARRLVLVFALWFGLSHCVGQTGTPTAASAPPLDPGPCSPLDPELPASDGTRGSDLWAAFEGSRELRVARRAGVADRDVDESPLKLTLTITRTDRTDAASNPCPGEARAPVVVQIVTDDAALEASARVWLIGTMAHATIELLDVPADRPDGQRIAAEIGLYPEQTELWLTLEPGGMRLESVADDSGR